MTKLKIFLFMNILFTAIYCDEDVFGADSNPRSENGTFIDSEKSFNATTNNQDYTKNVTCEQEALNDGISVKKCNITSNPEDPAKTEEPSKNNKTEESKPVKGSSKNETCEQEPLKDGISVKKCNITSNPEDPAKTEEPGKNNKTEESKPVKGSTKNVTCEQEPLKDGISVKKCNITSNPENPAKPDEPNKNNKTEESKPVKGSTKNVTCEQDGTSKGKCNNTSNPQGNLKPENPDFDKNKRCNTGRFRRRRRDCAVDDDSAGVEEGKKNADKGNDPLGVVYWVHKFIGSLG